jgi:hypothetical protein
MTAGTPSASIVAPRKKAPSGRGIPSPVSAPAASTANGSDSNDAVVTPFSMRNANSTTRVAASASTESLAQNTLVVEGQPRYEPTRLPGPHRPHLRRRPGPTQAVTWRTASRWVTEAVAEIAWPAPRRASPDGPHGPGASRRRCRRRTGWPTTTRRSSRTCVRTRCTRTGWEGGTWSEWFQFRTAATAFTRRSHSCTSGTRRTR